MEMTWGRASTSAEGSAAVGPVDGQLVRELTEWASAAGVGLSGEGGLLQRLTTMPVLQSLAQARQKWGDHQANAIWDASIVKVILGGASNSRDLQELSALIGERDDTTDSTTYDHYGGRSYQRSVRRVAIMPPDVLRTLPFGTGIVLLRTARPIITTLRPWTARSDTSLLHAARTEIEARLRQKAER